MKILNLLILVLFVAVISSCESDDEPTLTANVNITSPTNSGDIGGDVTGNGGNYSQTFNYINQSATADYNMDMTTSAAGTFNLVVQDADDKAVLSRTLIKGQGDDSASGVTTAGTPGTWKVIITLTEFNGDGSFSLSQGD